MSEFDPREFEFLAPVIEDVMDDCIKVLVLKGLEACSMEDFYEACGPHRAVIQEHFSTKREFCISALWLYMNSLYTGLKTVSSLYSDVHSAIEAALYEFVEIMVSKREKGVTDKFSVLIEIIAFDEELFAKFKEFLEGGMKQLSLKFTHSQNELENQENFEKLIYFYMMIMEGLFTMVHRPFPHTSLRETLFEFVDMSLRTLEFYEKKWVEKDFE